MQSDAPATSESAEARPRKPVLRRGHWSRRLVSLAVFAVLLGVATRILFEVSLWRGLACLESRSDTVAGRWLGTARLLSGLPWNDAPNGELHYQSARLFRRSEQFERFLTELNLAEDAGWPAELVARERLIAAAQTQQFEKVDGYWDKLLVEAGSDGPEICKAYTALALNRLRLDVALRIIETWQRDYPTDPEPHYLLGLVHSTLRRFKESLPHFEDALALNAHHRDARYRLARALMELLQFESAAEQLRILRADFPNDMEARIALAECLVRTDQADAAKQLLGEVTQTQDPEVLAVLGGIELKLGHHAAAAEHLGRAVEQRPEYADLRYSYARALQVLGRTEEAKEHFGFVDAAAKPLLRLNRLSNDLINEPENLQLRFEVGELTWKWKSHKEGARWLLSVLEQDPGHIGAHTILAEHFSQLGDEQATTFHRERAGLSNR